VNRFPRILAVGVAALALGAGACSSSSDKASSDTTVTSVAPSTTAKESTTTTAAPAVSSTTTAAANGCAQVTDSQVKAARPDLAITTWTCAVGTDGSVWVGGTGEAGGGAADVNYIIVKASGGTFANATDAQMAACSNPPIPATILQYCRAS
jgi:hypothetical protein